jgi:hypothetical protein
MQVLLKQEVMVIVVIVLTFDVSAVSLMEVLLISLWAFN